MATSAGSLLRGGSSLEPSRRLRGGGGVERGGAVEPGSRRVGRNALADGVPDVARLHGVVLARWSALLLVAQKLSVVRYNDETGGTTVVTAVLGAASINEFGFLSVDAVGLIIVRYA